MAETTIACPHCGFSRSVPEERIPEKTVRIVCPKCDRRFAWQRQAAKPAGAGKTQARPRTVTAVRRPTPAELVARAPKAGFGLRCVAAAIDAVVYGAVLLLLIIGFGLIISSSGGDNPRALTMIGMLAGFVVLVFNYLYRVFFIGYCGQTPGKMTTRIKVVRTSGAEVGFGAAIFREVIGKFISALLLMAGYLMVAFDDQHQGLHDKLADTYVIKL